MFSKIQINLLAFAFISIFFELNSADAIEFKCQPTPADMEGPFYEPNAPVRSSVGKGYQLGGVVKSAKDCAEIPGAKIEFWLAAPDGNYDDEHRATILADQSGKYLFECNVPPKYTSRPPHIHIRVTANGFQTVVTQHYPEKGSPKGDLLLVLIPK